MMNAESVLHVPEKKALRRAKEKEAEAVKKAEGKTVDENTALPAKVDELTNALASPDFWNARGQGQVNGAVAPRSR